MCHTKQHDNTAQSNTSTTQTTNMGAQGKMLRNKDGEQQAIFQTPKEKRNKQIQATQTKQIIELEQNSTHVTLSNSNKQQKRQEQTVTTKNNGAASIAQSRKQ